MSTKLLSLAVITILAVPTASFAGERCEHGMGMSGMGGGMQDAMMDRQAERKKMHDELKLTEKQEAAWKTYTDSMMPNKMEKENEHDWDKLTTPQRADKMLERSKKHSENMQSHVSAMKAVYATLTTAQQKTYDDFHADRKSKRDERMQERMNKKDMPMAK